jgi:hypothetical protein
MYLVKTEKYPCAFSEDEKRSRIEQSIRDARAGLGVGEDVMFSRHPEWNNLCPVFPKLSII